MNSFDIKTDKVWLMWGDCVERMAEIPPGSVDMVLCDPPYGTTQCKWDSVIPLPCMWGSLKACSKPNAAIVLNCAQPFTSQLISSNYPMFKYCWYWDKVLPRGHLNAKKMPLRVVEDIAVFYSKPPTYSPQKTTGHKRKVARTTYEKAGVGEQVYGAEKRDTTYDSSERYPTGLIRISSVDQTNRQHPTQKPVPLAEYLIKTYTDVGDTVLDFTMGGGTTGVACKNLGRNFIGVELGAEYYAAAAERIL